MAVYLPTATDTLSRSLLTFDPAQDWTIAGWFWFGSATTLGNYRALFSAGTDPVSDFIAPFFGLFTDGTPQVYGSADPGTGELATTAEPEPAETWDYYAVRYQASTTELSLVFNGAQVGGAVVVDLSAVTPVDLLSIGDGVGDGDFGIAYPRAWQRWMTTGELATESASRTAVITTNLLFQDLLEYASALGGWTLDGSVTTMGGPLNLDNNTAATATTIPSLPYSIVQNTAAHATDDEGGTDGFCAAWWTYTPVTCDLYLGLSQDNDFVPTMTVFSGSPGSLVEVGQVTGYETGSFVVRLDAGTDYYILIEAADGILDGGVVTLTAERQPNQLVPAGSLAFTSFDGAIWFIDRATGDTLTIRQLPTTDYGGFVDVRSNGSFLVQNPGGYNAKEGAAFSGALALLADDITTPSPNAQDAAFHSAATASYLPVPNDGMATFQTTLTEISAAGVVGSTWAIPSPAAGASDSDPTMTTVGVNTDATIAYYVDGTGGGYTQNLIKAWDLVNDLALSDLATVGPAPSGGDTNAYIVRDLLVTSDGSILVAAVWDGVLAPVQPSIVAKYDDTGTLLGTINLTGCEDGTRIYLAADGLDLENAWVYFETSDSPKTMRAWAITGSTFTVSTTLEWPFVTADIPPFVLPPHYVPWTTRATLQPCGTIPPPTPTTTRAIRRLRRFVLPAGEDNNRVVCNLLELILQAGEGTSTGQGENPQVMLRFSRDGGRTWGPEQWRSAGLMGEYQRLVRWRRQGQFRNAMVEIVVTDPVPWYLVKMLGTFTKGLP